MRKLRHLTSDLAAAIADLVAYECYDAFKAELAALSLHALHELRSLFWVGANRYDSLDAAVAQSRATNNVPAAIIADLGEQGDDNFAEGLRRGLGLPATRHLGNRLRCSSPLSIEYHEESASGTVYVPPGASVDMTATIALFTQLDPSVRFIATVGDGINTAYYKRSPTEWRAIPAHDDR